MIKKILALNLVNYSFDASQTYIKNNEYLILNDIQINRVIDVINKNPEKKEFNEIVVNNIKMNNLINSNLSILFFFSILGGFLIHYLTSENDKKLIEMKILEKKDTYYKYGFLVGSFLYILLVTSLIENYKKQVFNYYFLDKNFTYNNKNTTILFLGCLGICPSFFYFFIYSAKLDIIEIRIYILTISLIPLLFIGIYEYFMMVKKYEKYTKIREILQKNYNINEGKLYKTQETESIKMYL